MMPRWLDESLAASYQNFKYSQTVRLTVLPNRLKKRLPTDARPRGRGLYGFSCGDSVFSFSNSFLKLMVLFIKIFAGNHVFL